MFLGPRKSIYLQFHALKRFRFEDTEGFMSLELRPRSFVTFEKRVSGLTKRMLYLL